MRRGNISGGGERKRGKETFYQEEGRKENKKGRKQRKEREKKKKKKEGEKACRGSHSNVAGCGELSFHYSRGPAYWGIIGGIACRVQVNG